MERESNKEAKNYVWEGAIPLQIHLHQSEVTTLPSPPPALILAPRIGYLPLLVPQVKPFFSSALPPGVDTVWFDYKGLPLKWYIPTGVLFDLLCAEPERPWNLTVHFRGYPANILTPCENEDSIKWSYINSLKEAAYIFHGNCKNVMNMSQADQVELWQSVMNGNLEAYLRVSSKLKFGMFGDAFSLRLNSSSSKSHERAELDATGTITSGRIPVRLYVWSIQEDFDNLEDAPSFDSWDKISYINRPAEIDGEGKCFSLGDAIKILLPEIFGDKLSASDDISKAEVEDYSKLNPEEASNVEGTTVISESKDVESCNLSKPAEIKLLRIQGIEPKLEIPFTWLVNNLMNPDYFLHICVYVKVPEQTTT